MEKLKAVICGGPNAFSKCLPNQSKKIPHENKNSGIYEGEIQCIYSFQKFVTINMYPSNIHEKVDTPSLYTVIVQHQVT